MNKYLALGFSTFVLFSIQNISIAAETACGYDGVPEVTASSAPVPLPSTLVIKAGSLFDFDKTICRYPGRARLDEFALKVKEGTILEKLIIIGHTDNVGDPKYNMNLSLRRAQSVADYLTERGVDSSLIEVQGKGEISPIDKNTSSTGRANNRRVEINVKIAK